MKILVGIPCYKNKNLHYLLKIIHEYRSMNFDVHIVIFTESRKDLDDGIEQYVCDTLSNPRHLPFIHKKVFSDRINDYDLFIYSEDDTLVTEDNIKAYLDASAYLTGNEVAGFIRFEKDQDDNLHFCAFHSSYHWDPSSVIQRGPYLFAHFTNLHAACYVLTRDQLRTAIRSGNYFLGPRSENFYEILETAATDPYYICGLTKYLCISKIDHFFLHHMPNNYYHLMGISYQELHQQIDQLKRIYENKVSPTRLLNQENHSFFSKPFFEKIRTDLIHRISPDLKRVLSIGCGWGLTESELTKRGHEVVGIPLDPVIAVSAQSRGVETTESDFAKAYQQLKNQRFDCILINDILHQLDNPRGVIQQFKTLLNPNGCLVVSVPVFNYAYYLHGMIFRTTISMYPMKKNKKNQVKQVKRWLNDSGIEIVSSSYTFLPKYEQAARWTLGLLKHYFANKYVMVCKSKG